MLSHTKYSDFFQWLKNNNNETNTKISRWNSLLDACIFLQVILCISWGMAAVESIGDFVLFMMNKNSTNQFKSGFRAKKTERKLKLILDKKRFHFFHSFWNTRIEQKAKLGAKCLWNWKFQKKRRKILFKKKSTPWLLLFENVFCLPTINNLKCESFVLSFNHLITYFRICICAPFSLVPNQSPCCWVSRIFSFKSENELMLI